MIVLIFVFTFLDLGLNLRTCLVASLVIINSVFPAEIFLVTVQIKYVGLSLEIQNAKEILERYVPSKRRQGLGLHIACSSKE